MEKCLRDYKCWECPEAVKLKENIDEHIIIFQCKITGAKYYLTVYREKELLEPIVYCQATYGERENQTKVCIEKSRKYVDRFIIIHDGSLSDKFMEWAYREMKCELYYRPWEDNFPAYRNEYLKRALEKNKVCWVLVSDPDEVFCERFLQDLRGIVKASMKGEIYNIVQINSHDVWIYPDGHKEVSKSDFYKDLFFRLEPGVHYEGVGISKNVHETLINPRGWKMIRLPDIYYYEHIKSKMDVCERAFRNFYIGGGGINLGITNPKWVEFKQIVKKYYGELSWTEFKEILRKGNIAQELKDWLIAHKDDNERPDVDCEIRDAFSYYFLFLHPEENIGNWKPEPKEPPKGSWGEVEAYVEQCYRRILGRNADPEGKEHYTKQIIEGKIKREALPNILRNSIEYRMKMKSMVMKNEC